MLTSLFPLFYVTVEFHKFLRRGRAFKIRMCIKSTIKIYIALALAAESNNLTDSKVKHFVTMIFQ